MKLLSHKIILAVFLCSILLSISYAPNISNILSASASEAPFKDPFTSKPDQIIFDFFPSPKSDQPLTINDFTSPMLNSLTQGIDNREICGDGEDNDGDGRIDENCDVTE